MTNFYSDLVVRYVYNETNEILKSGLKRLLKTDAELNALYIHLKESRLVLNRNLKIQHPRKAVIDDILKYAAS